MMWYEITESVCATVMDLSREDDILACDTGQGLEEVEIPCSDKANTFGLKSFDGLFFRP